MNHKRVIIVIGTGRSGTSLLMKILENIGICHSKNLVEADSANPDGFWEDRDIVDLQEAFLKKLQQSTGMPIILQDVFKSVEAADLKRKLADILLAGIQDSNGLYAVKDPRTSTLLPIWMEIFRENNIKPIYLFACRNPQSIIQSLINLNVGGRQSEWWWLYRTIASLYYSKSDVFVVHYEDWFIRPIDQLNELMRYIGLGWLRSDIKSEDVIKSCVNKKLDRSTRRDDVENKKINEIYNILKNLRGCSFDMLDVQEKFNNYWDDMISFVGWIPEQVQEYNNHIALEKDIVIAEKNTIIQEKDIVIAEKNSIIQRKDAVITEKDRILEERLAFINNVNQSLIIYPILVLRNKAKKTLRQAKTVLLNIEQSAVYFGRNHIGENIKQHLRMFLPGKYRMRIVRIKNEKWNGPLISVITPYYNRAATINETIESVLGQTFQDFEYIIVDDGSSEAQSIRAFDNINNPKIRKIKQKNQGVASARNNGIRAARGKYILCLDSDDTIDPTYLEKAILIMELNPQYGIVYSNIKFFGIESGTFCYKPQFDIKSLIDGNMFTTASIFKKDAWEKSGGYKSALGFEDWEFWINLVEKGARAKLIPELLFSYRKAESSRFIEDSKKTDENIAKIKKFHPHYLRNINKIARQYRIKYIFEDNDRYRNIKDASQYLINNKVTKKSVLMLMPWLTFGGAETLVYNYCSKIKNEFDISIITGLESENEWEYKFKEITSSIYHLPNLFEDKEAYFDFIVNYIETRKIDVIHIIHNSCFYEMLPELKNKFPHIRVVSTVFNAIADHFGNSTKYADFIDVYTTDNTKVLDAYDKHMAMANAEKIVICNGIDCNEKFNPAHFNRSAEREKMGIKDDNIAIYFIGRLSPEKNPDIFVEAAKKILVKHTGVRFFVIGDGPMHGEIVKSIREFDNKNLTYLGYQADIPRYLSTADIFVLPSKIEGFPLSNIEAMSMGACVISSDVGGVSDAVQEGETGFLIQPNSSEELAQKIEFVISQKELMEKISKNARKAVEERFSIEILANNYNNLYKNIK